MKTSWGDFAALGGQAGRFASVFTTVVQIARRLEIVHPRYNTAPTVLLEWEFGSLYQLALGCSSIQATMALPT